MAIWQQVTAASTEGGRRFCTIFDKHVHALCDPPPKRTIIVSPDLTSVTFLHTVRTAQETLRLHNNYPLFTVNSNLLLAFASTAIFHFGPRQDG
jgi:hypothetical protein